jgi:exodeoxyribonuclease-1
MTPKQLAERWGYTKDPDAPARLPVKTLKYNRCPAICPTGLIRDEAIQQRLGITLDQIEANRAKLAALPALRQNIVRAQELMEAERGTSDKDAGLEAEELVHGGLYDDHDANLLRFVRAADPTELADLADKFHDNRLRDILPRYKARNFPASLSDEERQAWETYRMNKLFDGGDNSRLGQYFQQLGRCAEDPKYTDKQFLLEELQLYGQSLLPTEFS